MNAATGISPTITAVVLAVLLAFSTTLKWRGANVLRAVLFTGSSAPMFLLGILGLIVFYQDLGWVPANGRIAVVEGGKVKEIAIK